MWDPLDGDYATGLAAVRQGDSEIAPHSRAFEKVLSAIAEAEHDPREMASSSALVPPSTPPKGGKHSLADLHDVTAILAESTSPAAGSMGRSQALAAAAQAAALGGSARPRQVRVWDASEDKEDGPIDSEEIPIIIESKSKQPPPTRQARGSGFIPYDQSIEYGGGRTLRSYQVEGLNWLLAAWHGRRNVILADEMGLGKTAQMISFFEHMHRAGGVRGPFIVVAPLSTIAHWRRETEAWTDLSACVYHGSGGLGKTGSEVRAMIREWEWYYPGYAREPAALRFDVLITTYEIAIQDVEYLAEIPWVVMVVDEGHRLRGASSKLKEVLQGHLYNDRGDIAEKGIEADFRVLLTGTPLQNSMAELWSLLNFLEPEEFDNLEQFNLDFGELRTQEQVGKL